MTAPSDTNRPCFIFAGGGTGGHLFPGLSVAQALRQILPDAEILFLCTERPFDQSIMPHCGFRFQAQPVRPLPCPHRPGTWLPFLRGWFGSVRLCRELMQAHRPRAVLALGGYASGPAIKMANRLNIPTALLNPDAVPGKANRFGATLAGQIFIQWAPTADYFGKHRSKCLTTGCPIRPEFNRPFDRTDLLARFRLDPDKKTLLIVGGSQGGRNVNLAARNSILALAEQLFAQWQILHITGRADHESTRDFYQARDLPVQTHCFIDQMPELLAVTDLVIARAGASTLAELTALGIPAILLPYPYHKDNHQLRNAQILADRGAARIVTDDCDPDRTAPRLQEALQTCLAPGQLQAMGQAARSLARPNAAQVIAQALIDLPKL